MGTLGEKVKRSMCRKKRPESAMKRNATLRVKARPESVKQGSTLGHSGVEFYCWSKDDRGLDTQVLNGRWWGGGVQHSGRQKGRRGEVG